MKNKAIIFIILITIFVESGIAQIPDLLSAVPDSLRLHANSIVLFEKTTVELKSPGEAEKQVHREVAVMNEQGSDAGNFFASYYKFVTISSVEITLYTAGGEKIKRFGRSDMKDYSSMGDDLLIGDERNLLLMVSNNQYPYRVVMDYTVNYHGFITLPTWYPQDEDQSVLNALYTVTVPANYPISYQVRNFTSAPQKDLSKEGDRYSWTLKDIPAFQPEALGPSISDQKISVTAGPQKFSVDNYDGSAASWQTFGLWYYNLTTHRQQLPDEIISKVSSMTAGQTDPMIKAKILYNYLQQNTRYVNIALGIGGWQPLSANFVAEHGYGDCKALTNYMQALLAAAGIASYPALAAADEEDIDVSFSTNQFNHVILVVPSKKDTIWLECTSHDLPFNFLSSFTENRHVLMIKPEGGYIVKTPATAPNENFITSRFRVDLSDPTMALAGISMKFSGNESINYHLSLADLPDEKKLNYLREEIGLPNFTIKKFQYFPFNADSVSGEIKMDATIPEFLQITATRIFISPYLIPVWHQTISQKGKRKFPVVLEYAYDNEFDGSFKTPAGYRIETIPKDINLDNEFFRYESHFTSVSGEVESHYSITVKQSLIPAGKFEEFNALIHQVISDQKKKIVLVRI